VRNLYAVGVLAHPLVVKKPRSAAGVAQVLHVKKPHCAGGATHLDVTKPHGAAGPTNLPRVKKPHGAAGPTHPQGVKNQDAIGCVAHPVPAVIAAIFRSCDCPCQPPSGLNCRGEEKMQPHHLGTPTSGFWKQPRGDAAVQSLQTAQDASSMQVCSSQLLLCCSSALHLDAMDVHGQDHSSAANA